MPLLVARQWPVLRPAAAATRSLPCASIVPNRFRNFDQLRAYQPPPRHWGTLVPPSVQSHPRDLVKLIAPLQRAVSLRNTFCVFLVTPSYAHYLLDDDAFLRDTLLRAYHSPSPLPDLRIHTLCAVVDKLPITKIREYRPTEPPSAGTGVEGICYAFLPSDASVLSQEPSSPDKGAIDFIFAEHNINDTIYHDTLRLPLANTVFQTGTPSTMILSTWNAPDADRQITPVSKTNISHHGIRLIEQQPTDIVPALHVPLLPLTTPRTVEGCMGNIIRGVIGPEGKAIQASSELENVVPRFFRSRGQPAQATVAWALVIPEELKAIIAARTDELISRLPTDNESTESEHADTWERLWRSDPPLWNTLVSQALTEGARLHRVLSGGGGWGKKAGLLSLDPVPASQVAESSKDNSFFGMVDDPQDFESSLTPVVQDGDSIQFFISPKSELEQLVRTSGTKKNIHWLAGLGARSQMGWQLGTIPSTVDSIPGELPQSDNTKPAKSHRVRGFGALTEGAMTLTQHSRVGESKIKSVTTTIDVPFSRFWMQGNIAKPDEDKDSNHELNTPQYVPSTRVQNPTNSRSTMNPVGMLPSQQKRSFQHASICTRNFSSTCILKEPSRSPPKLTVAELVRKLKIQGHPTSGRLRVRTANAIMRRFEKFLDKQKANHKAVMSAIRQRDCRLMAVRFRTAMIEVADLMEADSVLDSVNRELVRRVSSKERGTAKRERLEKKAEKSEQKAQKAEGAEQKENRARKMAESRATTSRAPIRKFASFGLSTSSEINKKLQPVVSEVSRLTEEARAIMATMKHSKPHIRRMPVSKLATSQALNQTLGYTIQEILHVTEEARTILATIQQRKRQSSWRFIRRWGREATSVPLQSVSSPTDLLQLAHRMLREARVGIRRLRREVNIIGTLVRQRKYFLRRSTTDKRRIVQDRSLRIRRISPYTLRVSHYPSRSRFVQEKRGVRVRSQLSTVKFRSSTQRHPILEKKRKSDELAAKVASWLGGGGSASNDKSGLDALLATVEREESQDRRGGRRRRR